MYDKAVVVRRPQRLGKLAFNFLEFEKLTAEPKSGPELHQMRLAKSQEVHFTTQRKKGTAESRHTVRESVSRPGDAVRRRANTYSLYTVLVLVRLPQSGCTIPHISAREFQTWEPSLGLATRCGAGPIHTHRNHDV